MFIFSSDFIIAAVYLDSADKVSVQNSLFQQSNACSYNYSFQYSSEMYVCACRDACMCYLTDLSHEIRNVCAEDFFCFPM